MSRDELMATGDLIEADLEPPVAAAVVLPDAASGTSRSHAEQRRSKDDEAPRAPFMNAHDSQSVHRRMRQLDHSAAAAATTATASARSNYATDPDSDDAGYSEIAADETQRT